MSPHVIRWCLAASWVSVALLVFIATGAASGPSLLLLAVVGLAPPVMLMALWKDQVPTIAEVLHATEERRS